MTMPTNISNYAPLTSTVDKQGLVTFGENNNARQSTLLGNILSMRNRADKSPMDAAAYNNQVEAMADLTKDPNNSKLWSTHLDHMQAYNRSPQDYSATYGGSPLVSQIQKNFYNNNIPYLVDKGFASQINTGAPTPGYMDYVNATAKRLREEDKPGFFENTWNKISNNFGAFTEGALNIWNSINAYKANKDYMNIYKDSFNLQKQQYLDREDRAKKEFAALQSRRAGSSL